MTGGGRPPAAQVLRELARRYFPGCTETGQPFVTAPDAPSVLISMDGLRDRLICDYMMARRGEVPGTQALNETLAATAAMASQRRRTPAALRVAERDGLAYLDLGTPSGEAVQIGPAGWQVISRVPVLFRRTELTAPLPRPAEHGSADVARGLFNIPGRDEWALYMACRIASLLPGITHPVEVFTGPAGAGKTAVCRMTASWMDPLPGLNTSIPVPRDSRTWATSAAATYVAFVDNVSWIEGWWSDQLCKSASGDGWLDRALYTDGGVYVASFRNVVLLNGITLGQLRGDLADRTVIHEMTRPRRYIDEAAIAAMWQREHPAALAWLLDRAVDVMRRMAWGPQLPSTDRLVTFMRVVAAVDELWGTSAMAHWRASRQETLDELAAGDPVAVAVMAAFKEPWRGSAAELLSILRLRGGLDTDRGRQWTPAVLGQRLARATDALTAAGWQVQRGRTSGRGPERARYIEIAPPGFGLIGYENGHGIAHWDPARQQDQL